MGLKVARNRSQGQCKYDNIQLVKNAALVAYGVSLPNTYCMMVLANKMNFKQAINAFKCEEQGTNKPVH